MRRGAKYKLPFKRRKDKLTDYRKRLKLILSGKPRIVVRRSIKHMKAQIIKFDKKGDKVLTSATSQELNKLGWVGSTSNIPAAYLIGLLVGKKALKNNIKSVIMDIGLQRSVKGSRIYATLKGAIDAGLSVPCSEDIFPSEERIKGKHVVDYGSKLKKNKKEYKKRFSKTDPEKMGEMFEEIKSKIMKS